MVYFAGDFVNETATPLFLLKNMQLKNLRTIGSNNNHLKFSVTKNEEDNNDTNYNEDEENNQKNDSSKAENSNKDKQTNTDKNIENKSKNV